MNCATLLIPIIDQDPGYLRKALNSAATQDVATDVLVVVDPRTDERTRTVVRRFVGHASCFQVLDAGPEGFGASLNAGFRAAQTRRVGLLFSDDWIEPDTIRHACKIPADIVSTGAVVHHQDGSHSQSTRCPDAFAAITSHRERARYLSHFLLLDRHLVLSIGGVDESVGSTGVDDFDLLWTLLERGATAGLLNLPLYNYRDHARPRLSLRPARRQTAELSSVLTKHGEDEAISQVILAQHSRYFGRMIGEAEVSDRDEVSSKNPYLLARTYRHQVREGNLGAAFKLAKLLEMRPDLAEKQCEIRFMMRLAADLCPSAAFQLGRFYRDGIGGPTDRLEACRWFKLAARHQNAYAAKALGDLLDDKGEIWYRQGAQSGHAWSMRRLAALTSDPIDRARWLAQAAKTAEPEARERSKRELSRTPRGILESALVRSLRECGRVFDERQPNVIMAQLRATLSDVLPNRIKRDEIEALATALQFIAQGPSTAGGPTTTTRTGPRRYFVGDQDLAQMHARGWRKRDLFPHCFVVLPVAGPNARYLQERMMPERSGGSFATLIVHATGEAADCLRDETWFDDELHWHRLDLGRRGHVAFAILYFVDDDIIVLNLVSDIVQRQNRSPSARTRIERRFGGWPKLLMHATLAFAQSSGRRRVISPRASLALGMTDAKRSAKRALFDRVYDCQAVSRFHARPGDVWWAIDVKMNQDRIMAPRQVDLDPAFGEPTICILHDVERGAGHRDLEPEFASRADALAPAYLEQILEHEDRMGAVSTLAIVGRYFDKLPQAVRESKHLAFHGFDHWLDVDPDNASSVLGDLARCRKLCPRVTGFHLPRSQVGLGLRNCDLVAEDFRWIAAGARQLDIEKPVLRDGVVEVPVHVDDFDLHRRRIEPAAWMKEVETMIHRQSFSCIGLHDCYADHWLERFPDWLMRWSDKCQFTTLDQIAWKVAEAHAL